jgi:hypothetical protein
VRALRNRTWQGHEKYYRTKLLSLDTLGKNMQNSENNTDRLFRDRLLNHEVVPNPGVWNNIVNSMEAKNRKKRMIWMLGFASAASLVFAFLAGWYLAVKLPSEKNFQADAIHIKSEVPSRLLNAQTSTQSNSLQAESGSFHSELPSVEDNNNNQNRKLIQYASAIHPDLIAVSVAETSQRESLFVKFLSPLRVLLPSGRKSDTELITMNNAEYFSEADRAIIAQNMNSNKKTSKDEKHAVWAVGVQASPVYRFDVSGNTSKPESDPLLSVGSSNGSSSYVTNVTGGIKVEIITGKRMSVQSGVNYGEISQNSGEVGVSFAGHNWITDRFGIATDKEYAANPNNINSLSNNMILKTQMGLANIEMPQGVALATVNDSKNFAPEVARNFNLEQQAGYLEIPFVVRYKIIDKRFDLLVLGGINTNFLMSNNASLVDNNEVIGNGKTEGLNQLTFSSSVGMGVNYAIFNRFNLSLEPTMKIQLNSMNQQSGFDSRPYSIGIFTGISYQF